MVKAKDQLSGLLESLELLVSQAKAYGRALPPDNYPARVAVNTLGELAKQAMKEAQDLIHLIDAPETADHSLSNRELQVLTLAAKGLTNKEIAYRLGLSERTIQFHLNSVFNKTATESRTEAAALAVSRGWIKLKR